MNENFYDDGVGIYDCTKLSHVILLLGLLNDGLQNVLYGVRENANQTIKCKCCTKNDTHFQ